ncbi:MAG: L-fucose:H+ symporter permease [Bacteroidetes bacterium]|nr:L-fucose:H+ symporter permease [Bacteroidota bacterium]
MAIITTKTTSEGIDLSKSYLLPFILVTSLFFLWGMANILNSALIAHFQPVFEIKRTQALLVETAFYFGYFTIAIPAGLFMERYSYKKGILLGLILYALGALLFIPAAETLTFGFFLIALYIIASGLAFLETAANPYVTILGKAESSVQRLNFSQSFNGLALVVGPWVAGQFIFAGNEGTLSSIEQKQQAASAVVFPYTMLAATVLFVAALFYLIKMPEPAKGTQLKFDKSIFKNKILTNAIVAQLFYVGAQAGVWGITINFITTLLPNTSNEVASKNYMAVGTLLFVVGRFFGTWLMTIVKNNKLLTLYGACASLLCLLGIFSGGLVAVYSILILNFFMSIMFPTIFALGVKDLGEQTKLGSSLIIMAIVGGALMPPLMGIIADKIGIQQSLFIPFFCFLVVVYFGWKGYDVKSKTA